MRRLAANPSSASNAEIDIRHKRRGLSEKEFGQLLTSARASSISIQRFDWEQRVRIYRLSYLTGLHKKELGSLTPRL
jgi:hypothetical protein